MKLEEEGEVIIKRKNSRKRQEKKEGDILQRPGQEQGAVTPRQYAA